MNNPTEQIRVKVNRRDIDAPGKTLGKLSFKRVRWGRVFALLEMALLWPYIFGRSNTKFVNRDWMYFPNDSFTSEISSAVQILSRLFFIPHANVVSITFFQLFFFSITKVLFSYHYRVSFSIEFFTATCILNFYDTHFLLWNWLVLIRQILLMGWGESYVLWNEVFVRICWAWSGS